MTIIKKNIPNKNKTGSTTIINNNGGGITTPVIDNLTSNSNTSALSANQGRILNDTKLSSLNKDTAREVITFDRGLESKMDIKAGGFGPTNTGVGAAIYQNNNEWNVIADNLKVRKQLVTPTTITSDLKINNSITTSDYDDINDKGAALYLNQAKTEWNGILDNLTVRGKFNVTNLEVEEARHIGGDIYLTKAGFKCTKVEVMQEGGPMVRYKCYFDNVGKDGLKIYNQFQAGDLAFCLTFNNNQVRKWWRAVHGVGENYILVDGTQCLEGSSIPQEGDHIVQLGSLISEERQTSVILWTDSICLYRGINDFVLPEPYIRLDPKQTKIDAETINFLGKTIINGNFTVDTKGNLTVKGHIIATSGEFTGTIKANKGNIGNFIIKDGGLYNDTSTNANITITDNLNPSEATKSFIVNPRNLAPEERGAIVDVTHKVNEGDGIVASTTNGNAIWGITEDGQALTGYATGIGHGLSCNRADIRGLQLNVANIRFDGDNEARLTNLEEIDIVKIDKGVTSPYKIILLPPLNYTQGRRLTVINRSNVSHRIISQPLADGTSERFEKLNGDVPIIKLDMGDGRIVEAFGFEVNRYTAVELLNTGDTWTIINVYR